MNKNKLIYQILNEQNEQLYIFWCIKLLNEYPEYITKLMYLLFRHGEVINYKFKSLEIDKNQILGLFKYDVNNSIYYTYTFCINSFKRRNLDLILKKEINE